MNKRLSALAKGMLILGGLLILTGLGWGARLRLKAPPPPTITAAGAVVLAITVPALPAQATPETILFPATDRPEPTVLPTEPSYTTTPLVAHQPGRTVTAALSSATPTRLPPTSVPPTATPTPTPLPTAQEPPTRIVAPAIKLDARIVPMGWDMVNRDGTMVSDWVVPGQAVGWHMNSALPGQDGNIVLSGHHNIEGKVFRHLVDLEPGDEITLYVGDTPYFYTVTEKYILKEAGMPLDVRRKNAQWIMPTTEERLTLVSCWPYEWPGNSHRVIIVARPKDYLATITDAR